MARGGVAVAPRHTLVRHADPVLALVSLTDGLEPDRVPEDLAIELGGEVAVDSSLLGEGVDAREERLLAVGVLDGEGAVVGLDGGHLGDEALALGEGLDEAAVDGVEVAAEGGEVGHGGRATKKPAGWAGCESESGRCVTPSASSPPDA